MTNAEARPEKRAVPLTWAGWILTALLLAYAALLHKGIGPIPRNLESNWYNPSTFLLDALLASGPGAAMENVGSAIALLALPALGTAVAVFFTTRSSVARMLSTASVTAVAIFVYYGVEAPGVWSFFTGGGVSAWCSSPSAWAPPSRRRFWPRAGSAMDGPCG